MKESQFWKILKKATDHRVHWMRLESWSMAGLPDLHGIVEGVEFWAELKIARGSRVVLSPHQISWLTKRWRLGGRAVIIIYTPSDCLTSVYSGDQAKDIATLGVKVAPLYRAPLAVYDDDLINAILECPTSK